MIDFRNTNTLWSSILVETLQCLGLTTAIVCPGSRSTPLTVAFTQHREIETISVLDERSAAFFALGIAKKLRLPVALICTSGTAGANFYPAVIEAKESQVPLLILTADRPPELRNCRAGQTIDQQKLYGNYPNWQTELAVPSRKIKMLCYLRGNIIQAWERSLFPFKGVVHLNIPFCEPLAPINQTNINNLGSQFSLPEDFFANISPSHTKISNSYSLPSSLLQKWQQCEQGIIIAGLAQPEHPQQYCRAIAFLSNSLGWPVLAEALSPLRNYVQLNPYLISTYDLILRNPQLAAKLTPEMVIQLGELPTSKELRLWLDQTQSQRWIISSSRENLDPLHNRTIHLRTSIEQLATNLPSISPRKQENIQLKCLTI